MQHSIVNFQKLRDLEEFRWDSHFYMPEFLALESKFFNSMTLGSISKTCDLQSNGAFKVIFAILNDDNKKVIPYIRSGDVGDFFLNDSNLEKISREAHSKLQKTHTRKNDVLMARKGKIGGATIIGDDCVNYNSNDNVVNIKIVNEDIDPYYFVTFLNSKYGIDQIKRIATGNVQPWLSMYQVRNLKILPLSKGFQKKIRRTVEKAHNQKVMSKLLYNEAEELLLSELGIKTWKPRHKLTFTGKFSDTTKAERIDAEYFQPKYCEIVKAIYKHPHLKLGDLVNYTKGIEPGSNAYEEKGVPFVRISDVSINGIDRIEKRILKKLAKSYKHKFSPQKGDILFTKDGTIGISFVVNKNRESVLSGAFLILKLKKENIEREYLALVLNSIVGKQQIKKLSGGAIISHLKPSGAMSFQIPILPIDKQKKISQKIINSRKARKKTKNLLEKAKKAVEIAIEKNETEAKKYLR